MRRVGSIVLGLLMVAGLIATATPAQAQIPPLPLLDDYGDAPASYGVAQHGLLSAAVPIWLGDIILGFDPDLGNQPSVGAIDDDCNTVGGALVPIPVSCLPAPLNIVNELLSDGDNFILDDEDGVNVGPIVGGQPTAVSVNATADGFLDGFFDFNIDGDFTDAGENPINNLALLGGQNAITVNIPAGIPAAGLTYARFRYGSTPVVGATGAHPDGEVEDYLIAINQDFGDAPDNPAVLTDFPTLAAPSNGARHRASSLKLGANFDTEADGIPTPNAIGDDANPIAGPDDEDGVTLSAPLVPGTTVGVTIQSNGNGFIDAWADWNGDLDWTDLGEQIFASEPVTASNNPKQIVVPAGAQVGSVTTRWRLSSDGGHSFTGVASDGEVEDHQFAISTTGALDFGDAPETYHTTTFTNGPRHAVSPLILGNRIDSENQGQPSPDALLDDNTPSPAVDDEDGIDFSETVLVPGKATTVEVETSGTGFLDAWVDTDGDDRFDDVDEHVIDSEIVTACGDLNNNNPPTCTGTQEVTLHDAAGQHVRSDVRPVPAQLGGTNSPEGFVNDGEVEDYDLTIDLECGAVVIGDFVLPFNLNCPGNGPMITDCSSAITTPTST